MIWSQFIKWAMNIFSNQKLYGWTGQCIELSENSSTIKNFKMVKQTIKNKISCMKITLFSVFFPRAGLMYFVYYRESLLGQLTVHQKSVQQNFNDASGGRAPKGKNLPEFVNTIVYVRQLEAKVNHLWKSVVKLWFFDQYCLAIERQVA